MSPVNGQQLTSPGNLGRNTFTGPSWWNLDFSLVKNTRLSETTEMQFRAEFFQHFNHPTFQTPGATLAGNFGFSTATQTAERQIQFGLRFTF